ncbi:MAG: hypothetical protein Q9181_003186 [Wetmoreana brouardii]
MQLLSRLPFSQWILPDRTLSQGDVPNHPKISPPLYARGKNFSFSLKPIFRDSTAEFSVKSSLLTDPSADLEALERRSQLDRGQCEALLAALTREFVLIQGPPGTGKLCVGVQLMRVLQGCKSEAELGPVVVFCYTNHALDQFLEHLVQAGISKVIRIGGQSRSTVLEGKNLRVVSHGESKTKSEGWHLAVIYKALEEQEITIKKILATLHKIHKRPDWASLKHHLARSHRHIHAQFSRVDEDDFTTVGREPFDIWRTQNIPSVHSISSEYKKRLVEHWIREIRDNAIDDLFEAVKAADRLRQQLTDIHDEVDRRVLETADVIGVTTTGLARRIATLQRVKCKVVICKEAGEVMEPHILSASLPSVEHFIQIGDHQQLRPQINNYGLLLESQQGALYQLDRSQFERLANGDKDWPRILVAQLNFQRRMRPEISSLIRQTLYPRLVDHGNTKDLPDVVGMQKSTRSRTATPGSTGIAVLTPYTGQLQRLRAKMRNDFEIVLSDRDQETLAREGFNIVFEDNMTEGRPTGSQTTGSQLTGGQPVGGHKPLKRKKMSELLRVATVDNFQGEEAS